MLTLLRGHRAEGACDLGSDVWRQAGFHTTREGVSMSLYVHVSTRLPCLWPASAT